MLVIQKFEHQLSEPDHSHQNHLHNKLCNGKRDEITSLLVLDHLHFLRLPAKDHVRSKETFSCYRRFSLLDHVCVCEDEGMDYNGTLGARFRMYTSLRGALPLLGLT